MIEKIAGTKIAGAIKTTQPQGQSFKEMLNNKREAHSTNSVKMPKEMPSLMKTVFKDVIKNHEIVSNSVKTFLHKTDYSPEKLIKIQYKTGVYLLREQMFCKTAELSANTLKNFTQMQI